MEKNIYGELQVKMGASKNSGTTKSSILIGFFIINHPFWGTPIFGNTQMFQECPVLDDTTLLLTHQIKSLIASEVFLSL